MSNEKEASFLDWLKDQPPTERQEMFRYTMFPSDRDPHRAFEKRKEIADAFRAQVDKATGVLTDLSNPDGVMESGALVYLQDSHEFRNQTTGERIPIGHEEPVRTVMRAKREKIAAFARAIPYMLASLTGTLLSACGEEHQVNGDSGGSTDVDDFFATQMTSGGDVMPTADIPWIDGGKIDTGVRMNFVSSFAENGDTFEMTTSLGENGLNLHIYKITGSIDSDTGDLAVTDIDPIDTRTGTKTEFDYLQVNGSEYVLGELPGSAVIHFFENGEKKILTAPDNPYFGPESISPTSDEQKIFVIDGDDLYTLDLPVSQEGVMESVATSFTGDFIVRPWMLPNNAQRFVATLEANTSTGGTPCEFEYQGGIWQEISCLRDSDVKGAMAPVISTDGNYMAYTWLGDDFDLMYALADTDGDKVPDVIDNCKTVANANQADGDGDGIGDACDEPQDPDADGDGYPASEDCDDTNPSVHPGAPEDCAPSDNNCDGSPDDGAVDKSTWYRNMDGDNFGDPTVTAKACTQPSGYLPDKKDCDDSKSNIGKATDGTCDGDGDGVIDKTAGGPDCDDADPKIPGEVEVIGDGKNNDCKDDTPDTTAAMGTPDITAGGTDVWVIAGNPPQVDQETGNLTFDSPEFSVTIRGNENTMATGPQGTVILGSGGFAKSAQGEIIAQVIGSQNGTTGQWEIHLGNSGQASLRGRADPSPDSCPN